MYSRDQVQKPGMGARNRHKGREHGTAPHIGTRNKYKGREHGSEPGKGITQEQIQRNTTK